jgi:hypothetical protein
MSPRVAMRRYRFEVTAPEHFPDPEGALLRNLEDAKHEARRLGEALIRDYPEAFDKPGPRLMVVLDDAGQVLAQIDLGTQTRTGFRLSGPLPAPLKSGKRLGPWTFSGGELYLSQRSRKKD